jgi:hypothetical protein
MAQNIVIERVDHIGVRVRRTLYATWELAEVGHRRAVLRVRNRIGSRSATTPMPGFDRPQRLRCVQGFKSWATHCGTAIWSAWCRFASPPPVSGYARHQPDVGSGRLGNLATPKRVQKLQMALHAKAKAEAGYRFYALYDKISREDILAHAYAQCRSNKGAPGVDGQDFADIEAYGVERWLAELALALRQETYRPENTSD